MEFYTLELAWTLDMKHLIYSFYFTLIENSAYPYWKVECVGSLAKVAVKIYFTFKERGLSYSLCSHFNYDFLASFLIRIT